MVPDLAYIILEWQHCVADILFGIHNAAPMISHTICCCVSTH